MSFLPPKRSNISRLPSDRLYLGFFILSQRVPGS